MSFRIAILAALLASIPATHATVVPLPGSTPQSSVDGTFPNPVRLQVLNERGAPVAGVSVGFVVPYGMRTSAVTTAIDVCYIEPFIPCSRGTDSNGIVDLGVFSGGNTPVAVMTVGTDRYGSADIVFGGNGNEPIRLEVISGDHQVATIGRALPQPIVLRATRPDGQPVAGQPVASTLTDADGYATLPPPFAGWILGDRAVRFETADTVVGVVVTASIEYTAVNVDGSDTLHVQNLWWAGPSEDGWGASIVQHDDRLFTVLYVYDNAGNPTWFPATGTLRDSSIETPLYVTEGTPFWSTGARQLRVDTLGRLYLDFQGDSQAKLTAVTFAQGAQIAGLPSGSIAFETIAPMDLTGNVASPVTGVADLWWGGPSELGWGLVMIEQYGSLVALWFTYDDNGKPTWFIMPGGQWLDASTYAGSIYKTSGPRWFNGVFLRSLVRTEEVGRFSLHFIDIGNATFDYTVQGHGGHHPLTRQPF